MRKRIFKIFFWLFGFKNTPINNGKKGTIIILIDGLSFDALRVAIKKRYCPTLKKMSSARYILHEYYCGLPAATTATEALLFYGNNDNIPGFTWFDRTLQKFVRGNRSSELTPFEDLFQKKRSLLKNGSVIMGVYSGGSTELSMSGRNLTFSRSFYILKTSHYFLMALLYPGQLFRTLYLTLKTLILYRRSDRHTSKETLSKIVLGQFSCFLSEIEIMRNTEKIFVDFLLYDEYAHEYGTTHPATFSTLRLIDKYIKRIARTANNAERPYDIILLSDHGQTDSIPLDFPQIKSTELIKKALNNDSYHVIRTYGSPIVKDEMNVYVVPAGSTLQLYFSDGLSNGLSSEEIIERSPQFIINLLTNEEFGWVLVKNKDKTGTLYGKKGFITFSPNTPPKMTGEPFPEVERDEAQRIISSFQNYQSFSNNGDLIIFGNITRQKKVYSFEKHKGTHGGFYGAMTHPFIMTTNPKIRKEVESASCTMKSIFDTVQSAMEE